MDRAGRFALDVSPTVSALVNSMISAAPETQDYSGACSTTSVRQVEPALSQEQSQCTNGDNRGHGCEWTPGETKLLLDYYGQNFTRVGRTKKVRNKKAMFSQIAVNLKDTLGVVRTGEQCSTRYKTVMKRKKTAITHNNKSGNSPTRVPFEDEVKKIRWLDDSLETAQLRDSHGVISKNVRRNPPSTTTSRSSQRDITDSVEDYEERASTLDGVQPTRSHSSADYAPKQPSNTSVRSSTARAQEMKVFFEEVERLQKLKEEKKAAREEQRRLRHEEKKEYRVQLRKERTARHEEKMRLLKRVFGLTNDE